MKQETATKNKDGRVVQFPVKYDQKHPGRLILLPVLSGVICAILFGFILNLFIEKPTKPLLAEPSEETSPFTIEPMTFWVQQAGAFSTKEAADSFISTLPAGTPHVLVSQDEMNQLWIGAAASEAAAKEQGSSSPVDVYVKSVSTEPVEITLSEKDQQWFKALLTSIETKLQESGSDFNLPEVEPENDSLKGFYQEIIESDKDTAFLESLVLLMQIKNNSPST
ncbi:hypothetical protein [Jeotgalibacillus terrae]|uniref:SPOR domain-containing protein n=1 Tax=Jeotgalibacillus terrae TaxID=587735 RepID=A0ABW5ZJI0_9BACL|nr:hypothetical protein [Jeotgalibacillus terrae]MBM7578832.1 uncharacterized membrane protein YraQ (UPF0718 family) [Jeotgalibacillus terrae]